MPPEQSLPIGQLIKIFDPLDPTDDEVWFPGTAVTSQAVNCQHIWEDISCLLELRTASTNVHARKLLLKYVVMDVYSMFPALDVLHATIMEAETYTPPEQQPFRGISIGEKETAKKLWSAYSKARKAAEKPLRTIRNKIAAHRDVSDWQIWKQHWEQLKPDLVNDLLANIPPVVNHAKDLNIFDWNISHDDGTMTFLSGPIN
jgi:hypothetical protein